MSHTHHHHPLAPPTIGPSILRLSVWQRLAYAAAAAVLVWAVVLWAMRP